MDKFKLYCITKHPQSCDFYNDYSFFSSVVTAFKHAEKYGDPGDRITILECVGSSYEVVSMMIMFLNDDQALDLIDFLDITEICTITIKENNE